MRAPFVLVALLAGCAELPELEEYTSAEARARPFPTLWPVRLVESVGGRPRLAPGEADALLERGEAVRAAPAPPPNAADLRRAAELRERAAALRGEVLSEEDRARLTGTAAAGG